MIKYYLKEDIIVCLKEDENKWRKSSLLNLEAELYEERCKILISAVIIEEKTCFTNSLLYFSKYLKIDCF